MVAAEVDADAPAFVQRALLEQRLVLNATGPRTLRFLPPLVVTDAEIAEALGAWARSWPSVAGGRRSRSPTMPVVSARSASSARLRFCGTSPIPNFSNSARRWLLTASTLRNSSSAIDWLVAGTAKPSPLA